MPSCWGPREQKRVRQPNGIDRARFQDLDRRDEKQEQQDQSDDRIPLKPEKNAARFEAPEAPAHLTKRSFAVSQLQLRAPAGHDDENDQGPLDDWPKFGSMFRKIRSAGIRVSTKAAMTGPTIPPRPPVRLTPPMTTAANPLNV